MIPPVEVRQVRPCEVCILYYDDDGCIPTCNSLEDSLPEAFKMRFPDFHFGNYPAVKDYPCKDHLTREEYRELIDSGGIL